MAINKPNPTLGPIMVGACLVGRIENQAVATLQKIAIEKAFAPSISMAEGMSLPLLADQTVAVELQFFRGANLSAPTLHELNLKYDALFFATNALFRKILAIALLASLRFDPNDVLLVGAIINLLDVGDPEQLGIEPLDERFFELSTDELRIIIDWLGYIHTRGFVYSYSNQKTRCCAALERVLFKNKSA